MEVFIWLHWSERDGYNNSLLNRDKIYCLPVLSYSKHEFTTLNSVSYTVSMKKVAIIWKLYIRSTMDCIKSFWVGGKSFLLFILAAVVLHYYDLNWNLKMHSQWAFLCLKILYVGIPMCKVGSTAQVRCFENRVWN